ncbi:MAG: 4-hydroxy-tetrahydrodipicolinate synthase [Solirubrobacteraceae bacterium]
MPANLGSILTAMVTPFDAELRIDEDATVALMHHLVEHGSDGLVVCGTTGEVATLSDDEQLGLIELAVGEMRGRCTVVAGVGSNDTRHAVHLTERATELGADATLSVTPYYVRPNRRGIIRHFEEIAKATEKPIVLYNIPSRTGTDMPNDLLAELAQIDHVDAVKQANNANLAAIDGLELYAGNDEILCRTLELGGAGGICVASHLVGEQMRRMVDEPERRREIDAELQDVYGALAVTSNPIPVKAALNLLGHCVGGLRLPMVAADEQELAAIAGMLERRGLLRETSARL